MKRRRQLDQAREEASSQKHALEMVDKAIVLAKEATKQKTEDTKQETQIKLQKVADLQKDKAKIKEVMRKSVLAVERLRVAFPVALTKRIAAWLDVASVQGQAGLRN